MDEATWAFHEQFMLTIAPLLSSVGDTIKYHKLSHFTTAIKEMADLKHTNCNFFEHNHSGTKALYASTSKRTGNNQFYTEMVRLISPVSCQV